MMRTLLPQAVVTALLQQGLLAACSSSQQLPATAHGGDGGMSTSGDGAPRKPN
eukprot:SAG22_NODE_13826_length_393_cov_1.411565_1_plen_52_part_01